MGAYASTFTKDLADAVTKAAIDGHRLVRNREVIYNMALKDWTTIQARGTGDVLTKYRNPSFISRVTNRSASVTEVFFGNPDERQRRILQAAADYLVKSLVQLLVMDKQMGLHPAHSHHCRTIVTGQFARLLTMWNKLIFDLPASEEEKDPGQVLIMVPEWGDVAKKLDLQPRVILVDAVNRVTFVLGSDYFGEIKKGHLRMAMYLEKVRYREGKGGGLGVHAGGKVIRAFDAGRKKLQDKGALFFGLSGTGKTTLSVHHFWLDPKQGETVVIRQDDFFVMTEDGAAFGTEDNAYIKTEGLEPEGQPLLYAGAISPSAILENVYTDPKTLDVDFFRYDHPFGANGQCLNGRGIVVRRELDFTDTRIDLDHVDLIFFITRRETIVPPAARLNAEQAAAFFMLGESIITSAADPTKAGQSVREVGTNPFIVGSEGEEGNIFYRIIRKNPNVQCFLLNTGGFGGRTVERSTEALDNPAAVEKLRAYLGGAKHPDIGTMMEIELASGEKSSFKIASVLYEVMAGAMRVRAKNDLKAILEEIDGGTYNTGKAHLIEVAVLSGQKIRIQDSAAIIREIARSRVEWRKDEYWGYEVPAAIPGLDLTRYDLERYYTPAELAALLESLRAERIAWLAKFKDLDPVIAQAVK
ncbi:MAG TPA: phosphoenolpyruvate carboxykinase (ATP) [Candidatus Bathyarchaeia archaeon]|nr:phosphoenolpyruvate carboxykinase (ATP) [Candidatus Bathyarchaeia archaeon]